MRADGSVKAAAMVILAVAAGSASGQILHSSEPLPTFEVSTIRPWRPASAPASAGVPDGTAPARKVTKVAPVGTSRPVSDRLDFIGQVELLIESAYGLPMSSEQRIIGGPEWVRSESDRYEVVAKIEDSRFAAMQRLSQTEQQRQLALMEQALLADRFKLKVHFEMREMPVYALVVAKGGVKLAAAADGETMQLSLAGSGQELGLVAKAVTLDEFVRSPFLRIDGRTIQNQTNLDGRFDFSLRWARQGPGAVSGDQPDLFTALQEQLGLKLTPARAPVEVIVINDIERPEEN